MRVNPFICVAILAAIAPAMALADDPRDATMRSAAARARDSELTRQLNRQESAMVRRRDARQAQGWHAAGSADDDTASHDAYTARLQDHERDMAAYARDRARYEQDMAAWRRAVAACRADDAEACGN